MFAELVPCDEFYLWFTFLQSKPAPTETDLNNRYQHWVVKICYGSKRIQIHIKHKFILLICPYFLHQSHSTYIYIAFKGN